jgi:hypothetical protein
LDANAYASAMTTTTTEERDSTDRSEKPTRVNGLGEKTVGHEAWANSRPNGKLRH